MSNFFSNIQQYFSSVATAISTTLLVIFPFAAKPQTRPIPTPTPTPVIVQEVKGINILPTPTSGIKKINLISKPTPTPTPTPTPSSTPASQAPKVSLEALCKGYTDELRATTKTMVGVSVYDSTPYYELTNTKFYNYCLANNGNTSGFKVEPPPAMSTPVAVPTTIPVPTIAPIIQPVYVVSDSSWKFSMNSLSDWLNVSFNDSSWISTEAPSAGQCSSSVIIPTSWIRDNGTLPMSVSNPNWVGKTGYFRKSFNLSFIPSSSTLKTLHDDDGDIYINGHLVYSDHDGLVNKYAGDTGIRTVTVDPTVFIQGQNVIGVVGIDSAGGCQSVQVELIINP